MRGRWMVGLAIVLACSLFYFYSTRATEAGADPLSGFEGWSPEPDVIKKAVLDSPGDASEASEKKRRDLLAKMLTGRFRNHDPQMAVRIYFQKPSLVALMCPARMEPWNMDRLALAIWQEAKSDLGQDVDVNIFLTFIGSPPIEVGELHSVAGAPPKAIIRYHKPRLLRAGGTHRNGTDLTENDQATPREARDGSGAAVFI